MQERVRKKDAVAMLLPKLQALRASKPSHAPVRVTVVGGSASGKGHLVAELLEALNGKGAPPDHAGVLPLDAYYLGAKERQLRGAPHFDHPAALDLAQAADDLRRMTVGKGLQIPRYDFSRGERAGSETFTAKRFVLVDGLFGLHDEALRALSDLSVFVECDHYGMLLRRLFRDAGPGGRTKQSSRQVLEQYFAEVWPAKRSFIDPTAGYADVIVESPYDAASEAGRAGPMQYQLKARAPTLSDDALAFLAGATRLSGEIRQVDRFLRQKGSDTQGDILRLRFEPDADGDLLLTYKGPLTVVAGARSRAVTSAIALPREALKWFGDDYAIEATLEKRRVLYQAGNLIVARDCVKNLGNFVELRAASAAEAKRMPKLLAKLCPGEPPIEASYLDLWRAGAPLSVRP
jgi:uridine kinase